MLSTSLARARWPSSITAGAKASVPANVADAIALTRSVSRSIGHRSSGVFASPPSKGDATQSYTGLTGRQPATETATTQNSRARCESKTQDRALLRSRVKARRKGLPLGNTCPARRQARVKPGAREYSTRRRDGSETLLRENARHGSVQAMSLFCSRFPAKPGPKKIDRVLEPLLKSVTRNGARGPVGLNPYLH